MRKIYFYFTAFLEESITKSIWFCAKNIYSSKLTSLHVISEHQIIKLVCQFLIIKLSR